MQSPNHYVLESLSKNLTFSVFRLVKSQTNLKIKAQNPQLINESGFKLRVAYDGARTVVQMTKSSN